MTCKVPDEYSSADKARRSSVERTAKAAGDPVSGGLVLAGQAHEVQSVNAVHNGHADVSKQV